MTTPIAVTLPPGRYFVGDPCYVIPDAQWSDFCDIVFASPSYTIAVFRDQLMFAGGTAFGDGTYLDQNGHEYGVDAGMLGIVPEALWDAIPMEEMQRLGNVVTFDNSFVASWDQGQFSFGNIFINTRDDDVDNSGEDVDYSDIEIDD